MWTIACCERSSNGISDFWVAVRWLFLELWQSVWSPSKQIWDIFFLKSIYVIIFSSQCLHYTLFPDSTKKNVFVENSAAAWPASRSIYSCVYFNEKCFYDSKKIAAYFSFYLSRTFSFYVCTRPGDINFWPCKLENIVKTINALGLERENCIRQI